MTGAVDIGGTKTQVGVVDDTGNILAEQCFPTDCRHQSARQAMDRVCEFLQMQCESLGIQMQSLRGIGVSCAGPVDITEGVIENPYTLAGWMGFAVVKYLSEKTHLRVRMENDANGALLGEIFQRELQKKKVLMLTFGTGIGVAFWSGGTLYRSGKYHPEMGHVIVSSEGDECYCGHRGCFESRCSGQALNIRSVNAGYRDFDELYVRAKAGEAKAGALLEQILADIKNGIWNLNIIFKPEIIILAGGFARHYFTLLKEAVLTDSCGKEDFLEKFEVLPASKNQNSALVGANLLF